METFLNKGKLCFWYEDANICQAVSNVEMSVLVVNSKVDTVTPQFMGQDIYDAISSSKKMIWTLEDSEHRL